MEAALAEMALDTTIDSMDDDQDFINDKGCQTTAVQGHCSEQLLLNRGRRCLRVRLREY